MTFSKTKTSFYRCIYTAYLIDNGVNSVPLLCAETGMPRRTAQDTIAALEELDITCEFIGATKDGCYSITAWGAINKNWIKNNLQHITYVLEYPHIKI